MPGVRLHHPSFASCTYVVELETPYHNRLPKMCPLCGKEHQRKSIHLNLDAGGNAIVSREVFAQLRKVPTMAGMEVANEVEAPPPLSIGAVDRAKIQVFEAPLAGNGQSFYVPPQTKYEAERTSLKPYEPLIEQLHDEMDRRETAKLRRKGWRAFDMNKGKGK